MRPIIPPAARRLAVTVACTALSLSACASVSDGDATVPGGDSLDAITESTQTSAPTSTALPLTLPLTTRATTTLPPATTTTATSITTTTSTTSTLPVATTLAPTTTTAEIAPAIPPAIPPASPPAAPPAITHQLDLTTGNITLGTSVLGRPIIAERFGTVGGRRVLVIGVIHGNEDDGVAMIQQLRTRVVPDNVELWLVESMNPDGQAAQNRQNANEVDLNRNFPYKWGPIGEPGNSQYAGVGPASEPETQAMVNFISQLRPDIAVWYHQDANLVIPSTGRDGRIRARYAELTGLPIADCCGSGGVYTGIAATWARNELKKDSDAVAFIVELPGSLTPEQATQHTDAILTIATEG